MLKGNGFELGGCVCLCQACGAGPKGFEEEEDMTGTCTAMASGVALEWRSGSSQFKERVLLMVSAGGRASTC
jgi:hypothetical protein